MTEANAKLFIVVALGVAVVAWLAALVLLVWWRRPRTMPPVEQTLAKRSVPAVRDALGRAAALMQPPWDLIGGETRDAQNYAVFEAPTYAKATARVRVQVDGTTNNATAVVCTSEASDTTPWPLWVTGLFLLVIPVAAALLAMWSWGQAESAANDAARMRVLQMMQVVHLLWPPFMFLGMWRAASTMSRKQVQRFITSLDLIVPTGSNEQTGNLAVAESQNPNHE